MNTTLKYITCFLSLMFLANGLALAESPTFKYTKFDNIKGLNKIFISGDGLNLFLTGIDQTTPYFHQLNYASQSEQWNPMTVYFSNQPTPNHFDDITFVSSDGTVMAGSYLDNNNKYVPFFYKNNQGSYQFTALTQSQYSDTYLNTVSSDGGLLGGQKKKQNGQYHAVTITTASGYTVDNNLADSVSNFDRDPTVTRRYGYDLDSFDQSTVVGIAKTDDDATIIVGNFYRNSYQDATTRQSKTASGVARNDLPADFCIQSVNKEKGNCVAFIYKKDNNGGITKELILKQNPLTLAQDISLPKNISMLRGVFPEATAVSGNGSTVVGWVLTKQVTSGSGSSATGSHRRNYKAFSYDINSKKMTFIGTLAPDRISGESQALAVNRDGSVVVGDSEIDPDQDLKHAFWYHKGGPMVDLGGIQDLKNSESSAQSVSDDGNVIAGYYLNSNKQKRPVVWIKNEPESSSPETKPSGTKPSGTKPSETKPSGTKSPRFTAVDLIDSHKSFALMAQKDHDLHALWRSALSNLADRHCLLEENAYCIGVFTYGDHLYHDAQLLNTGIHAALRLGSHVSAGVSLAYVADDTLPGGMKSRGHNHPGLGLFLRYAGNHDNSGLKLTASAAWQERKLTIRRTRVNNLTEPGRGESEIEGALFAVNGSYGVKLAEDALFSPTVGLNYRKTRRRAYRETKDALTPADYGKSGERLTALNLGLGLDRTLSPRFSVHGDIGTEVVLDRARDPFTAHAKYIGGEGKDYAQSGDKKYCLPYANLGISMRLGARQSSLVRLQAGIAKSDYGNNDANIAISYDYRF